MYIHALVHHVSQTSTHSHVRCLQSPTGQHEHVRKSRDAAGKIATAYYEMKKFLEKQGLMYASIFNYIVHEYTARSQP